MLYQGKGWTMESRNLDSRSALASHPPEASPQMQNICAILVLVRASERSLRKVKDHQKWTYKSQEQWILWNQLYFPEQGAKWRGKQQSYQGYDLRNWKYAQREVEKALRRKSWILEVEKPDFLWGKPIQRSPFQTGDNGGQAKETSQSQWLTFLHYIKYQW